MGRVGGGGGGEGGQVRGEGRKTDRRRRNAGHDHNTNGDSHEGQLSWHCIFSNMQHYMWILLILKQYQAKKHFFQNFHTTDEAVCIRVFVFNQHKSPDVTCTTI